MLLSIGGASLSDQEGQGFAEYVLILAPLTAVLAFAICMFVIATSS